MVKKITKRIVRKISKYDTISVRFPVGTSKEIKSVSDSLYYGRSVSDYVKECVLCNLKQDSSVINGQVEGERI